MSSRCNELRRANTRRMLGIGLSLPLCCLCFHPISPGRTFGVRCTFAVGWSGDGLGECKANALQVTSELEQVTAKGQRRTGRRERESQAAKRRPGHPLNLTTLWTRG